MRIAFLHARVDPTYAEIMLTSVRKHMDCELVHLTDETTRALDGCTVIRRPWIDNPMIFKMRHLAELEGDAIALDTDVIVQADLSPVFDDEFDVALTRRKGPIIDADGTDVTIAMPFNCGVMFYREPAFWEACLKWCPPDVGWYADQLAVAAVSPQFKTRVLECDEWNYTPGSRAENVAARKVVHYKGQRKAWMLNHGA